MRWCPQPNPVSQLPCIPFQDDTDINIDCATEEKHPNKRVCNVSYPFFRAKAKVMPSPQETFGSGGQVCPTPKPAVGSAAQTQSRFHFQDKEPTFPPSLSTMHFPASN